MNCEDAVLSEINQSEEGKYWMIILVGIIQVTRIVKFLVRGFQFCKTERIGRLVA